MADELTPDQVRAQRFDLVRKGYDRGQVDKYLTDVAAELDRATAAASEAIRREVTVGIDDPEALAQELHSIGSDVGAIIESARAAAEGMRTRASDHAETWRSEAESESTTLVTDANEQSHSMRASAWNEGSSMLSSATAEAASIVAEAKDESLFVRAEAEREALRLTGDAKRDREEIMRAARLEAEQLLDATRVESDGVLATANLQAESAQERARALEVRRSELLGELEAARSSIGQLESEIEDKRQELEPPEPQKEEFDDGRSHHTSDGGSVRIVASHKAVTLEPVDPEEFVAEVVALHTTEHLTDAVQPVIPETIAVIVPDLPDETPDQLAEVVEAEPATAIEPEPEPSSTEVITEPELPEPVDVEPALPTPVAVASEVLQTEEPPRIDESDAVEPESAPDADPEESADAADSIGSLFASLRDSDADPEPAPAPKKAKAAKPSPDPVPAVDESKRVIPDTDGATPEATDSDGDDTPGPEAAVIAAQNAALRTIKRTLVDLQNDTLEHLRTDEQWVPNEAFVDRFAEPFSELGLALTGEPDEVSGAVFGTDLYDAVSSAVERSRDDGAGDREIASATSRVFRTWRSDEAERRVVAAAEAYSVDA